MLANAANNNLLILIYWEFTFCHSEAITSLMLSSSMPTMC